MPSLVYWDLFVNKKKQEESAAAWVASVERMMLLYAKSPSLDKARGRGGLAGADRLASAGNRWGGPYQKKVPLGKMVLVKITQAGPL